MAGKLCPGELELQERFKAAKLASGYRDGASSSVAWIEFQAATLKAFDAHWNDDIYGDPIMHSRALANIYTGGDDCIPTARAEAWKVATADPFLARWAPRGGAGGAVDAVTAAVGSVPGVSQVAALVGVPVWALAVAVLVVAFAWWTR